ncbi:MAG TPA: hypothetical protein VIF64_00550 [Pyrinomonadaceae bacterium]
MKNSKKTGLTSSKTVRRLAWIGMIVAVFAIAATAAVSLRTSQAKDSTPKADNGETKDKSRANLSFRVGGQIPLDPQTGQVRPLTPEEAKEMAEGIKQLVNQSTDGLQSVRHADGSVSIDLQGRFQSIAVAKRDEDGKVIESCVDNPKSAAAFFEIDPQLLGVRQDTTSPRTNRAKIEKGSDQ